MLTACAHFLWSVNYTAIPSDRTVRSGPSRSEKYTGPPNGVFCATQAMYRRSPLSPDRVNRLHRGASMPEVVVHTAGCTEKVLAVAVTVPVHGTESLDRLTTYWTGARHGRKGCCTSDLPMQLGGELYATCTRTPVSSSLPREVLAAAVVVQPLCGDIYD